MAHSRPSRERACGLDGRRTLTWVQLTQTYSDPRNGLCWIPQCVRVCIGSQIMTTILRRTSFGTYCHPPPTPDPRRVLTGPTAIHDIHVLGNTHRIHRRTTVPSSLVHCPGVNLLPRHIVPMSHLRYRNSRNSTDMTMSSFCSSPSTPPFLPKNFHTHRKPHLRHLANDVIKHVA